MKTVFGLLPWAIVLALVGVAIWFLVVRDIAAGAWLLAGVLLGHGLVHGLFFVPQPEPAAASASSQTWPFEIARTWPAAGLGLDPGVLRAIGAALVGAVVAGFGLAALATIGVLVPAAWWPALVAVSSALSLATLGLFFAPGLVLGVGIDALLLWLVAASAWSPAGA
jgi:hypothetical protein